MIYYIYKITFLCGSSEGRYYIGKRTFRGFNIEKVLQFTLSGEYITTFKSIKDAVKAVNGNHSAICSCCKGRRSIAYGYKWKYVNDLCQS